MSARRWSILPLVLLLLGTYAYRAVHGLRAGWNFDRGQMLRARGDYEGALPRLDAAAIGVNQRRALLTAADVRLDLWEQHVRHRGALAADRDHLVRAARGYLEGRCVAPGERRAWQGLGEVYDAVEWIEREWRSAKPYSPPANPWLRVGRPGRIAVGMLRVAVESSPNWSQLQDRLALTLWNYGLEELAREAVRQSARVLPVYSKHPFDRVGELPDWVPEEFAVGSRDVLGQVPLFPRTGHLIELGKLERRIGADDRAIEVLREALEAGGDELRLAEARFHLGLALVAEERYDEGRAQLELARRHPSFRPSVLRSMAAIERQLGNHRQALEQLRMLRWDQPRALRPCLQFAEVAREVGDWSAAIEALRWARLNHPDEIEPYVGLAEIFLQQGDTASASRALDDLEQVVGKPHPAARRIRQALERQSPYGSR